MAQRTEAIPALECWWQKEGDWAPIRTEIPGWVVRVEVAGGGLPPGRQEPRDRDLRVVTVFLLQAAICRQEGVAVAVRGLEGTPAAAAVKGARGPPTGSRDRRLSMPEGEEGGVDVQKPRPGWVESAGEETEGRTPRKAGKMANPTRVVEEGVVGHPTGLVDPAESADRAS